MVEVLAAIIILSLAILPMVSMFDASLRAAVLGGNYDTGRALANEKLEEIKALSYAEAVNRYGPSEPTNDPPKSGSEGEFEYETKTFHVDSELQRDDEARTRMQVDVMVEWDDGDKSYTTSGLITASAP